MSFCNIVSHTFLNRATIHGQPTDKFSVDIKQECQHHLLTDDRTQALRGRVDRPLNDLDTLTLHEYLCGKHRHYLGLEEFQGTEELPLLAPHNRVIHFKTEEDSSLVIKGQDTPEKGKAVITPSGVSFSHPFDHFSRLKMGDWMRQIKENQQLDRIEIADDYAVKAPIKNLPLKQKYYIVSDFIPDLLPPKEGLQELEALPIHEREKLIRQIAVMIQKSGYMDFHFGNVFFKKDAAGELIAVFIDLEPFGLFRTREEPRRNDDEISEPWLTQIALNRSNPITPDSLEECSRLGLEAMGLRFFAAHEKDLIKAATMGLAKKVIGQALLETQAAIESCQTTPLSSINPSSCLQASCCAPCLCVKACKVWKETQHSPNRGKPPHQIMEELLPPQKRLVLTLPRL
ncbi:MAG TPA: hypothetical protein VLE89_03535 [Chlamydiales bacterium]|nr:hypothetical protein [Chlamydiales bacterium]